MTSESSEEDKAKLLEQLRKYNVIEARIFTLLATRKFEELSSLGDGSGLSAAELAEAYDPDQWPGIESQFHGISFSRAISANTNDRCCTVEIRLESPSSPTLCYTVTDEQGPDRTINIGSIGGMRGGETA